MNLKVNLSEKRKSPVSKEKKPNLVENPEDRNKENDPNSVKEDAEQEQDASAKARIFSPFKLENTNLAFI